MEDRVISAFKFYIRSFAFVVLFFLVVLFVLGWFRFHKSLYWGVRNQDILNDTLQLPIATFRDITLRGIASFVDFYLMIISEQMERGHKDFARCITSYKGYPMFFVLVEGFGEDSCIVDFEVLYTHLGEYIVEGDSIIRYLWSKDYQVKYALPGTYSFGLVFFHKEMMNSMCESLFIVPSDTLVLGITITYYKKEDDFLEYMYRTYYDENECLSMRIIVIDSVVVPLIWWFDPIK